ncbi:MAG: TolB protein [Gemmatimonadetes bacterium]|nr:TolB protein [Gemmatimonadota bacterium]
MRPFMAAAAVAAIAVLWAPLSGCSSDSSSDSTVGALTISVTTTGSVPDPDGYTITVGDRSPQTIGVNGTLSVNNLSEGQYTVTLAGMADQCFSSGDDPVVVAVDGGTTKEVHFSVACPGGGSKVAVNVIVTGADPDTNGYMLKIGAAAPRHIFPEGTTTVASDTIGTLPLVLSDVAANCTPDPTNPTSVKVVAGQTAQVTLKLSCAPTTGAIRIAVTISGSDLPALGYLFALDAKDTVSTGDSTATVAHLAPGAHAVIVVQQAKYTDPGLQLNCTVSGGNPHNATVVVGGTVDLALTVTCAPLPVVTATVTSSGNLSDIDGYELTLKGPTAALTHVLALPVNGSATPLSLLNGSYVATVSGIKGNCYLVGSEKRTVAVAASMSLPLAVQCDPERQIAVVRGLRSGAEIGIISTEGSYSRLTSNTVADSNPAWSPDGNRIAYASSLTGSGDIYVMDAAGQGNQRLTASPAPDYQPAWSPDGSRIAFVSERDGAREIYIMNADGTNPVRLTADAGSNTEPAWLPGGNRLVFVSTRTGIRALYQMNPDGSGVSLLAGYAMSPSWSPAGNAIVVVSTPDNPNNAPGSTDLITLETLSPSGTLIATHKASISGKAVGEPAWGPDGRIAYSSAGTCTTTQCSLLTAISADGTGRNFVAAFNDVTEPAWRP